MSRIISYDTAQKRPEMGDNFAYTLARIQWDLFGTLTFKGDVPRPQKMYSFAWRHMRHAAELSAQPYGKLLIALRYELGEMNGRPHFHYLLGGTNTRNAITLGFRMAYQWKGMHGGHGVIRQYDRALAGASYVAKCLGGANAYEQNKFALANEVTLSDSVYAVIKSLNQMRADTQSAAVKKRFQAERNIESVGMTGALCNAG